jgi:predicted secreted Zn-dependent protease
VRARFATDRYRVDGGTETEVLRSLLAHGPRHGGDVFFGLTASQADLRYHTETSAAGCALVDVVVDLDVTVTLPRWRRPPGAPRALRRSWDRFLAALSRHEAEHRRIAVENAEALHAAVAGLRRPTCAAVTEAARRRVARHQTEAAAAHRRFDAETGHGRTEGATWPAPGD